MKFSEDPMYHDYDWLPKTVLIYFIYNLWKEQAAAIEF